MGFDHYITVRSDHSAPAIGLPGGPISSAQKAYALSLMEHIEPSESWGVTGGVSTSTRQYALKNGWLPLSGQEDWQVNSMGWVDGNGRDYLVAIMSSGNPTEQYGIDTVQDISTAVWNGLA